MDFLSVGEGSGVVVVWGTYRQCVRQIINSKRNGKKINMEIFLISVYNRFSGVL